MFPGRSQRFLVHSEWRKGITSHKAGVVADALMFTVATLFHMSAQGRRPAGFDGAHHSRLPERQEPAGTVGGPVAAEDAGHFEGWPEQGSARRGLRFPGSSPLFAGRRRLIERPDNAADGLRRHGGISGRGFDAAVAE